jgi:hypothetical protein
MNSNFLFVKNYCSNIANEEPDEEFCWGLFFGFGSVFVEIQSNLGDALRGSFSKTAQTTDRPVETGQPGPAQKGLDNFNHWANQHQAY